MIEEKPRPLLETHPHLKNFVVYLDQLNRESARGAVLICAASLDELLMRVIHAFLVEGRSAEKLLTGFNAPLGTFSARIEATHAMGLISDDEHYDASVIRKIRNEFAHALTASFDDPMIKSRCALLRFRAKNYGDVVVDSRGQFSSAATALILNLTNRPHYVGLKSLTRQPWPY